MSRANMSSLQGENSGKFTIKGAQEKDFSQDDPSDQADQEITSERSGSFLSTLQSELTQERLRTIEIGLKEAKDDISELKKRKSARPPDVIAKLQEEVQILSFETRLSSGILILTICALIINGVFSCS